MSPRRFLTDSDRYPWRPLKVIAIAVAVLLTAVCGGGGWTPRTPRLPPPPPPDLSVSIPASPYVLSPDGVRVASFRSLSSILIYDWQAKSHPLILEDQNCPIGTTITRFSPDGRLVAHMCLNTGIIVWETTDGKRVFTAPCSFSNLSTIMAWSHDGRRLATSCNRQIDVWEIFTGKKVSYFQQTEKSGRITGLAFTRSGEIYSSDSTGWVRLWSATGESLRAITFNSTVLGLLLSPDEKELAVIQKNPDVAGIGDEVVLWDSVTGLKRRLKAVNADLPELVTFSPDGKLLVLRIGEGRVSVFSTVSNQYVATLGDADRVRDVVFRRDGTIVAIVGRQVRTWRCCGR